MKTKLVRSLLICAFFIFFILWGLFEYSQINLLSKETVLKVEVDKYVKAELITSRFTSRKWMNYGMEIAKQTNFAPTSAARFYSYIASVYSEVLEVSNEAEASLATGEIIKILAPTQKDATNQMLLSVRASKNLSQQSAKILNDYKKRLVEDNYDLIWDKSTPKDESKWYVRNDKIDKGAEAGKWSTWILSADDVLVVPNPPIAGSLLDRLEMKKVSYAVLDRRLEDVNTIYFWHGSTGFEKGVNMDNVTPAGVWQNILYTEISKMAKKQMDDKEYAYAQKVLAQSIADAFIKCWQVKYNYWTQRPSMKINKLNTLVADPPFPSYVSGHSTISATAAVVLSALYPEQSQIWKDNLTDARNSRLLAGIHFDFDNKIGENLGIQIGEIIVRKVIKNENFSYVGNINSVPSNNKVINYFELGLFEFQEFTKVFSNKYLKIYHKYFDTPIFQNVIADSGIKVLAPSAGASFTDYDNDGDLDIFISGRGSNKRLRLYRNDAGKFVDVTAEAGLQNSRNALVFSGIFGDYDNDGCLDLFMTGDLDYKTKRANTWLYHSDCKGNFTDETQKSGINNKYHGRGSSWVDYDSDGDLDIYITNQGNYIGTEVYYFEPNMLYRNNSNGTFTDVTTLAGVDGLMRDVCPALRPRIEVKGKGFKASLQPIWFDYNNDNHIDLFVATDSGYSPLYKNNGDGTFTNVTAEAGMCKPGTGMGVSIGDYDNDSDFDIYVTNVGGNFLWENQGNGRFLENAYAVGVGDKTSLGWGTGFFDYDNDGYLDLYVVNGDVMGGNSTPEIGKVRIDRLYHNLGNKKFVSVAESEGITGDDPKEGATFGDYDGNGFEDILVLTGRKEHEANFRLYKNLGNNNHWVTLKLVGTKSNKDAVGAKITLISDDMVQMRQVVSGSSFLSQNSLWQTFGLGKNKKINEIKIVWPSGRVQILKDVKTIDQKITVLEPEA